MSYAPTPVATFRTNTFMTWTIKCLNKLFIGFNVQIVGEAKSLSGTSNRAGEEGGDGTQEAQADGGAQERPAGAD